jgi:hypothetical protein
MSPTLEMTPEQRTAMRDLLVETVNAAASPRPRHVVGRRTGLAVGVLAALVVGAVAVLPHRPPAATAPAMLTAAAVVTPADPVAGPGQYLRISTRAEYLAIDSPAQGAEASTGYLSPELHETFLPHDPTAEPVRRTTYLRPTVFFGAGARERAAADWAAQVPKVVVARPEPTADGPQPLDQDVLPRSPQALLALLRARQPVPGIPADENAFEQAADMLRQGDVKPDLRAALYRALALIPGISVSDGAAVLDGATGTAFTLAVYSGDNRREILIDPHSGRYLGERLITVKGFGAVPAGTAMESTAVTLAVADHAPA